MRETQFTAYIDQCIIETYAKKDSDGLHLDVYDLPKKELPHLIERLIESDTSIIETLFMQLQEVIDKRLPIVEAAA